MLGDIIGLFIVDREHYKNYRVGLRLGSKVPRSSRGQDGKRSDQTTGSGGWTRGSSGCCRVVKLADHRSHR